MGKSSKKRENRADSASLKKSQQTILAALPWPAGHFMAFENLKQFFSFGFCRLNELHLARALRMHAPRCVAVAPLRALYLIYCVF